MKFTVTQRKDGEFNVLWSGELSGNWNPLTEVNLAVKNEYARIHEWLEGWGVREPDRWIQVNEDGQRASIVVYYTPEEILELDGGGGKAVCREEAYLVWEVYAE